MAEKYTEAQKRASQKYLADKAQIKITVTPEQRDRYQMIASNQGKSLTQLITQLLEEAKDMKMYVADKETGTFIEEVKSVAEGKELIRRYEEEDEKNGCYKPNYYDVVDENHFTLLYLSQVR